MPQQTHIEYVQEAARIREQQAAELGEKHRKFMQDLNERAVKNLHANEAARQTEQTMTDQEKHEQALKASLKESYVKANGSEFGFAEAFPRLRAAHVEAQTLANLAPKPATTKDVAERVLGLLYGKR